VKWIPQGAARYVVGGVEHRLKGDKVLLLHEGDAYDMEFMAPHVSESFCLFFSRALVAESLDGGRLEPGADVVFRPSPALTSALHALRRRLDGPRPSAQELEERLLLLLDGFAAVSRDHHRRVDALPARRATTRRALFARLQRAREMIEDNLARPPSLEALARESCLSRFHLLRLFKTAFDRSPMAYAAQRRTERAKDLLRGSSLPIERIGERLGYASPSAFARTFKRMTGVTPSAFRD